MSKVFIKFDLDKEVVSLCGALNSIPGIQTTSSCSGHGQSPSTIWLRAKNVEVLNLILWAGCHRWWSWSVDCDLLLDIADPDRDGRDIRLLIQSKASGAEAYFAFEELAKSINKFIMEWIVEVAEVQS